MNPLPQAWATTLDAGRPAVLAAGLGDARWGADVVSDGVRLWWRTPQGWVPLPWPDVRHVVTGEDRVDAWLANGSHVQATADGWRRVARRASVVGPGDVWRNSGFVYARDPLLRVVDVDRGDAWTGPGGSVLTGSADWATHGASPRRTPRPLAVPLAWDTVRLASEGCGVSGIDPDGRWVRLDLRTGAMESQGEGQPWTSAGYLDAEGFVIEEGRRQGPGGLREASCAQRGEWLAGPQGQLWSLRTGKPVLDAPAVRLGATVATEAGFVTVDWQTHAGCTIAASPAARTEPFTLPLSDEDLVTGGMAVDAAALFATASGRAFRVLGSEVQEVASAVCPSSEEEELDLGEAGTMMGSGSAVVGGVWFGWTEDGWLFAVPRSGRR